MWRSAEDADDRPLVGQDVQPRERPHEIRDEERRNDEQQEEVAPRACPERDPVDERIREDETRDRRDACVHERAHELLVVVADPVREVRELPRELEVREEPGLEGLVAQECERDQEEDRQPEDPRREQEIGRDAPVSVEERAHAATRSTCPGPQPLLFVVGVGEHRGIVLVELREHGRRSGKPACSRGIRVELRRLFLHALDRRDVAGAEGELSSDLRVVDEVHVRRGGRHAAAGRDEHVVGEEDPPRLRDRPFDLRVGEVDDVAGPRHAGREVAFRERLRVVVAVEPADLARILSFLHRGQRAVERLVGDLGGIVAVLEHDEPERVAHRVPDADLALELRIGEELRDARDWPGDLLVPRDPVHSREPGERVLPLRVEGRARLRVDEVRDVRDEALVELLRPALREYSPRAVVVRRDDDVAADPLPLAQTALDRREVLRVRIDVLVVVDLDARPSW